MFPRIEVEQDGSRISPRSGATQNLGMWESVFDTEARPASEVFFESIKSSKGKGARKPTKKDKDDKDDKEYQDDKDYKGGGGSNNKLYYAVFFSKKI
jgi:hypothetical protein